MVANPNLSHANFFPRRVVVVRPVAGNFAADELQWNGQPDIDDASASFTVVPRMVYIKCMECTRMGMPANVAPNALAFVRERVGGTTRQDRGEGSEKSREIVLCTNRLLKSDYDEDKIKKLEFPQKSLASVEEVLAREVTKMKEILKFDRSEICSVGAAQSEIMAALAAECYFNKHGKEVKKGSQLMSGYSMLPAPLKHWARNRCVRSVAVTNMNKDVYTPNEAKKMVEKAMENMLE